jgi:HAMP domain-containing protein
MTRGGSVRPVHRSAGEDERAVIKWRRIALEKQLPTPRFPAGVWVPATVCCWGLVLVAVLCAVLFGATAGQQAPQAVVDSQQQLVAGLARVLDNAFRATVDGVDNAADRYARGQRDPAALLDGLDDGVVRWAGTVVLDARTRQPVAARGEPVPVAQLGSTVERTTFRAVLQGIEPRIVVATPLAGGRVLAGVSVLRVRPLHLDPDQQQAILIGLTGGPPQTQARPVQGTDPSADATIMTTIRAAVRATGGGDPASRIVPSGETALVAVAAPVGDSGLAVASAVRTPLVNAGPRGLGVPPAVGLLLAAGFAFGLLYTALIRPVRRLLALAKARACGAPARGWFWLAEARRIEAALAGPGNGPGRGDPPHRGDPRGDRPRRGDPRGRRPDRRGRPRGVPAVLAALAAAAVVAFWAAGTVVTYGGGARTVPAQVVSDTGNQIESVAIALGDVLDSGRVQLATAAARAGTGTGALRSTLEQLADRDSRYRSLYLADAAGRPQLTVGRKPLRQERPLPADSGVQLDNTTGRLPVIYAHTRTADGRSLVAEFDVAFLARLLERIDGRVRVVDTGRRTILDTEGYRAFQPIPASASRALLDRSAGQTQTDVLTAAGGLYPVLAASTPLAAPASAAPLKWTVVAERAVSDLRLPPNDVRRAALLSAGAAIVLAVLALGWQYFVLLRPLRRLAVAADRLARGDTESVISPQRQDEIGAIAACLEICRQVRVDGAHRLGGAVRLRGSDHDFTTVMPAIRVPLKDDPVPQSPAIRPAARPQPTRDR